MTSDEQQERTVQKVVGGFEMWDGRRAREVLAEYGDGTTCREIEVESDGRYGLEFKEVS